MVTQILNTISEKVKGQETKRKGIFLFIYHTEEEGKYCLFIPWASTTGETTEHYKALANIYKKYSHSYSSPEALLGGIPNHSTRQLKVVI